jgi:hypothetical protein
VQILHEKIGFGHEFERTQIGDPFAILSNVALIFGTKYMRIGDPQGITDRSDPGQMRAEDAESGQIWSVMVTTELEIRRFGRDSRTRKCENEKTHTQC